MELVTGCVLVGRNMSNACIHMRDDNTWISKKPCR
jgi:hypothetical protein